MSNALPREGGTPTETKAKPWEHPPGSRLTCAQLPRVIRDQQPELLSLNLTYVFWGSDCSSYLGERPTEANKRLG